MPKAREGERQMLERHGPGRHRAAIDGATLVRERARCHGLDCRLDLALHRLLGLDVAARLGAERAGETEKARVLARAVVVQCRRLGAGAAERCCGRPMHRRVRAATQRRSIKACALEHRCRGRHVTGLAAMGRTGERQLLIGEPIAIGGARFDQRQRLQGLHGRARKHRAIDIAERQHTRAVRIHDRDRAAMAALHQHAAQYLDQNGIGHASPASQTLQFLHVRQHSTPFARYGPSRHIPVPTPSTISIPCDARSEKC